MTPKIDSGTLRVRKELMQTVSSNLFFSSAAVFINIVIILIGFWDISNSYFLLIWFFLLSGILIFRNIQAKKFLNESLEVSLEIIEKRFMRTTTLTAIVLSIGVIVIIPDNQPFYQAFLVMVMGGLSAGAVMSLSVYKNVARNYLIILLVPLVYIIYEQGTQLHILLSILIALYLFMLIIFLKKYNRNIVDNITSRILFEESQKELEVSKNRFSVIFNQSPVGICSYNTDLIILEVNHELAHILKTSVDVLKGFNIRNIADQRIIPCFDVTLLNEKGFYEGEYHTQISDEKIWVSMQTVPLYNVDNKLEGGLAIVYDITQRMEEQRLIRHQAFYDTLTNLANRFTFNDRLEQQLARLVRHHRLGAVMFIDIDNFKAINDTLGHGVGDEVLKIFASRILSITRREDTVARLGGDEFVVLLSDLSGNITQSINVAQNIAEKTHAIMRDTFEIQEHSLTITLSLGITIIGNKDESIDTILKYADIAMYKAKADGRNCTRIYES